jgi:hypothetical protein
MQAPGYTYSSQDIYRVHFNLEGLPKEVILRYQSYEDKEYKKKIKFSDRNSKREFTEYKDPVEQDILTTLLSGPAKVRKIEHKDSPNDTLEVLVKSKGGIVNASKLRYTLRDGVGFNKITTIEDLEKIVANLDMLLEYPVLQKKEYADPAYSLEESKNTVVSNAHFAYEFYKDNRYFLAQHRNDPALTEIGRVYYSWLKPESDKAKAKRLAKDAKRSAKNAEQEAKQKRKDEARIAAGKPVKPKKVYTPRTAGDDTPPPR